MRRIVCEGSKCTMEFRTPTALPNAIRRALMSDVETYAPSEIVVHRNSSSQTDEYIAHRIGLIPFVLRDASAPPTDIHLSVCGRTASTADFVGDSFRAVHDTPIVRLVEGQTLHIEVRFAKGTPALHVKHAHIGPVAYQKRGETTTLSFETLTNESPLQYALTALQSLHQRVDDTIHFVETQYDQKRTLESANGGPRE